MTPSYIWYSLLNINPGRKMLRLEIPDDALAAVRPLLEQDGLHSSIIPEIGLDLAVSRSGPVLYCTGKIPGHDAFVFVVAKRSRGAGDWWRELHLTALDIYQTDPQAPPEAPWLGLALAAQLKHGHQQATLASIGLAKACAWAWVEGA